MGERVSKLYPVTIEAAASVPCTWCYEYLFKLFSVSLICILCAAHQIHTFWRRFFPLKSQIMSIDQCGQGAVPVVHRCFYTSKDYEQQCKNSTTPALYEYSIQPAIDRGRSVLYSSRSIDRYRRSFCFATTYLCNTSARIRYVLVHEFMQKRGVLKIRSNNRRLKCT